MTSAYDRLLGQQLWQADGRKGRRDDVTYREALHASYLGPYSNWKHYDWDGLVSNNPGMITTDPELGFDLTMPAGQAQSGGYTTRDFASAPHGVDYGVHFSDWCQDPSAHPNLLMPGRTILHQGMRPECLALGPALTGTGGACAQDWTGIDFATMARHGNRRKSMYEGFGLTWLPDNSLFPRLYRATRLLDRRKGPFREPVVPGQAPMYLVLAVINGWTKATCVYLDPGAAHDVAYHWTADGQTVSAWVDGHEILTVAQGDVVVPAGVRTRGRVAFNRSGLHACAWQDNGSGNPDVQGVAGNPKDDQVYTIERMAVYAAD